MKKCLIGLIAAAEVLMAGTVFAETKLSVGMGLNIPFTFVDLVSKQSGITTEVEEVVLGEAQDDFRFKLENERAGVEVNLRPKLIPQGGVSNLGLDTYFAWFKPIPSLKVTAGSADDRHWFKGAEERVIEKFGEISIIDCYSENELGVYYGLISNPLLRNSSEPFWRPWGHEEGSVRWERSYGWASSQLGTGTNLQVAYAPNGEKGFFATGALVEHYWPNSGNEAEYEWTNTKWASGDNDALIFVPEIQGRVGYGFRNSSIELVYKAPHLGNNVVAAFYQPRLLRGKLIGTFGATFANDIADGSEKYNGRANEFMAFAVDARAQYNFNDKLRAKIWLNYSQVTPGDNNNYKYNHEFATTSPRYHYLNANNETVGNKPEMGFYAVGSVGYNLPLGAVNLDAGYYMRDLDNNDGYDLGENFLTVKGSWTYWIVPGAGFSVGGEWYHRTNTGDYGKNIRNYTMDGIKDEFRFGTNVLVKLGI